MIRQRCADCGDPKHDLVAHHVVLTDDRGENVRICTEPRCYCESKRFYLAAAPAALHPSERN